MRKLIVMALALFSTAAAAHDPYANIVSEQRAKDYYARRTMVVNDVKFAFFAKGCGVLLGDGAGIIKNRIVYPLYQPSSGLDAVPAGETGRMEAMVRTAEQEGLAQSKNPGACDWFRDNPAVIVNLRAAAQPRPY